MSFLMMLGVGEAWESWELVGGSGFRVSVDEMHSWGCVGRVG
jgi:hypothetical protein